MLEPAERILSASPCADATAPSLPHIHATLTELSRGKPMALAMDVFKTDAADLEIPSGELGLRQMLRIILIDPAHRSNCLSTFWIIILLSNV